jgi:hypothetical protein
MLQKLSEQTKLCFDRSLHAKRTAGETADSARKADFLENGEALAGSCSKL